MLIHFVGDVHGNWGVLNKFIAAERPERIIQVGDFGYFPKEDKYDPAQHIKPQKSHIEWIDGNHEDHEALRDAGNSFCLVDKDTLGTVYYRQRGSDGFLDGTAIMYMGGAESYDKPSLTPGFDWFPEETITIADIERALDTGIQPDIVVSHTCPECALHIAAPHPYIQPGPSERALTQLFKHINPKLWVFGHWHKPSTKRIGDTQFLSLGKLGDSGGWKALDIRDGMWYNGVKRERIH